MHNILPNTYVQFYALQSISYHICAASRPSLNGAVTQQAHLKNRPRIPTPDVTKEGMEKENRFNLTPVVPSMGGAGLNSAVAMAGLGAAGSGNALGHSSGSGMGSGLAAAMGASNIAAGVALAARKLATEPSVYPTNDYHGHDSPIANLLLSPIKELDSGSVNNTLHPGSPSTVELARALQAGGPFGTITTTTSKYKAVICNLCALQINNSVWAVSLF